MTTSHDDWRTPIQLPGRVYHADELELPRLVLFDLPHTWTPEDDQVLIAAFTAGHTIAVVADYLKRGPLAVAARYGILYSQGKLPGLDPANVPFGSTSDAASGQRNTSSAPGAEVASHG